MIPQARGGRLLVAWIVAGLLPVSSSPLHSASPPAKEIRHKSRDLEKVQAEMEKKRKEQERLRKESEELSKEVREYRLRMKNVEKSLLHTRQRTQQVQQEVAVTKMRRDHVLTKVQENRRALTATARRYYVAYYTAAPRSPAAVSTRVILERRADRLRQAKGQAESTSEDLNRLMETQDVIREEAHRQQGMLSDVRSKTDEKNRLLSKKMTQQEEIEAEIRELKETAERLASLIDNLRSRAKEEAEAEKQARLKKATSGESPILAKSLPWPIRGKIRTKFGRQKHPSLNTTYISNGVVIAAEEPQPVLAVADGKVLYAGQFMSYGSMAVVEHEGDWFTVYGQLSRWDVEKGQEIKAGEPVGQTGFLPGGGNQAYFELRFYGKPTNPLPWMTAP